MNRRNFILGLGTAATLSGAASVTGASISGTADADANFQVIAENNLTIQRNTGLTEDNFGNISNTTYDNYVNTNVSYINETASGGEGTINSTIGSGVEDVNGPRLTVNDAQDDSLSMALATPNDDTIEDNQNDSLGSNPSPYTDTGSAAPPLEIVNNGGSEKTISAEYNYGSAPGTGSLTDGDVAQLFTFSVNANGSDTVSSGKISPSPSSPNDSGDADGNQAELAAGGRATVDFTINYSQALEDRIADAASGGSDYDFANQGFSSVDLLSSVVFGEVDGTN